MSVLADLRTDVHSKIVYCLGALYYALAYALGPLNADLLAYLEESECRLPVSGVREGFDVPLEEHEAFLDHRDEPEEPVSEEHEEPHQA